MPKLICDFDLRVQCGGDAIVSFAANIEREVPQHLYDVCRKNGAFPPGGAAPKKASKKKEDPHHALSVLNAVREILEKGNPDLIDSEGLPRVAEVKKSTTSNVTKAQIRTALGTLAEEELDSELDSDS